MTDDGFDAMGKSVPPARRTAALRALRQMIPDITTQHATLTVDRVASALERDQPYEAQRYAMEVVDLTGAYRLMAHLLTGPS